MSGQRTVAAPPSVRAYESLRAGILHGDFHPGQALKPQELARTHGVSLAVIRECLLRLVGEGLAERLPNRGFVVPDAGDARWQLIAEARAAVEPAMLRLAIARGDLEWEARVRAAHHRLAGTPAFSADDDVHFTEAWGGAHHAFHRALLDGCGNDVLLGTFERLWTASELSRRWSGAHNPTRDYLAEHQRLEVLALTRDADGAAAALAAHVIITAEVLVEASNVAPASTAAAATTATAATRAPRTRG